MFSLKTLKIYAVFIMILLSAAACRFWQPAQTSTPAPTPFNAAEVQSETPFSAKEPEVFQAEIVVTTGGIENRTRISRNAANRRYDYDYGTINQLTSLLTDKNYLILPSKKIYAENVGAANTMPSDDDFLYNALLNSKISAKFEKLETIENVTKYRVTPDGQNASEIYIYVDGKIGLPVKQEFFSGSGENKTLTYAVEIKNLKLETDAEMFAVPNGVKKVAVEDLRKELNRENK